MCLLNVHRATVEELLKEYKACESPDYISYVSPFHKPWVIAKNLTGSHLFNFLFPYLYRVYTMSKLNDLSRILLVPCTTTVSASPFPFYCFHSVPNVVSDALRQHTNPSKKQTLY